jgi:hypothetical protein
MALIEKRLKQLENLCGHRFSSFPHENIIVDADIPNTHIPSTSTNSTYMVPSQIGNPSSILLVKKPPAADVRGPVFLKK